MKEHIENIVKKAVSCGASDIHIEPREEFVRLRLRIDGLLSEQEQLPKADQSALISSIKVMANIDISENRIPQDGKIIFKQHKKTFDLRVSTLPTIHGEKIVIRILDRNKTERSLIDLGFEEDDLLLYKKMISKRSGMILITGPTGSGKTTTLYATLKELNHKENNIITLEDPVEYQIPGINQVQINLKSGLTFPKLLRSVLRQDPDIILVGEIRDSETARIAIQAALTGHLVLSTLHTKDAPAAAKRLIELGVENYLVSDALVGVIAQRLLRVAPSGRKAIFEIMPGTDASKRKKSLFDEAKRMVDCGKTTNEEVARILGI